MTFAKAVIALLATGLVSARGAVAGLGGRSLQRHARDIRRRLAYLIRVHSDLSGSRLVALRA